MSKSIFITVNYCNADITIDLLNNILELRCIENFTIAVVDNSPDKDDFIKLEKFKNSLPWPSLLLYKPSGNIGYFGAVYFVLNKFGEEKKEFQHVIISNNDIEIRDKDFLKKLLVLKEDAAVIAPNIISSLTGMHQNPHFLNPISKWQKNQYRLLYSNFYLGWFLYHSRRLVRSFKKNNDLKMNIKKQEIFSAHGAFMILEKKFFQAGGIIDHGYFLYGEEISISAQCRGMKLKIIYCPELIVFHNEHTTTKGHGFKRNIYELQQRAYKYIKNKYSDIY